MKNPLLLLSLGKKVLCQLWLVLAVLALPMALQASNFGKAISVLIPPPSTPVISYTGSLTICSGQSLVLSIQPQGDIASYAWSNGATTSTITVTESGTYFVSVTSTDGFTSPNSLPVIVTVLPAPPIPVVSALSSPILCQSDSVTLSASLPAPDTTLNRLLGFQIGTGYTCNCPAGYVAVGYQGNYGGIIDFFRFACKRLNPDGTLGSTIVYSNNIGTGTGGTARPTFTAGGDSVLTKFKVRKTNAFGNAFNGVRASASAIASVINNTTTNNPIPELLSISSGGTADSITIPAGHVIVGAEAYANASTFACGFKLKTVAISSLLPNFVWSNGATTSSIRVGNAASFTARQIAGSCTSATSNAVAVVVSNPTSSNQVINLCYGGYVLLGTDTLRSSGIYHDTIANAAGCDSVITLRLNVLPFSGSTIAENICEGSSFQFGGVSRTASGIYYDTLRSSSGCDSIITLTLAVVPRNNTLTYTYSGSAGTSNQIAGFTFIGTNNGRNYYHSNGFAGNYSNARGICAAYGGDLATIPNAEVNALIANSLTDGNSVYIGVNDILNEGIYRNVDGTSATYFNWAPGEPNDSDHSQNVVQMTAGSGQWNDLSTNTSLNFILETPIVQTISLCVGQSLPVTNEQAGTNYIWKRNGVVIPSANTANYTLVEPGIYTASVVSPTGCLVSSNVLNMNFDTIAVPTATASTTTFCNGDSAILTASGGSQYLWSTGATTSAITVRNSGSYTVQQIARGCTSIASAPVVINATPLPTTPTISGSAIFCTGGNTILISSATSGNLWSTGETTRSITVNTAGDYSVRSIVGACTSAVSEVVTVAIISLPSQPVISGSNDICSGRSTVLTSSAPIGNLWNTGATTQSITVTAGGTYTVQVVAGNCSSAVSNVFRVNVLISPLPPTITGETSFCSGRSTVLTSSAPNHNLWSNGDTSRSITVTTPGTYTVQEVGTLCTSLASAPLVVTENATPVVPVVTGNATYCSGSNTVLTSSVASNILWSNGATTPSITVSNPGTYSVVAYNTSCTSAISNTIVVTEVLTPATPVITGEANFCTGGFTILTSSLATGNLWSNGATTQTITVTSPGTYTVQGINGACTSATSAAFVVNEVAIPAVAIISGNNSYCSGTSTVLTSSNVTGNLWSNGETTQSITVSTPGTYSVRGVNSVCTSVVSNEIIVSEIPTPSSPTISGESSFCQGGSTTLTSSAATGNLWSNGATTQTITVSDTGHFSVRVIANGCTSAVSAIIGVTINPRPTAPGINSARAVTLCGGDTITLRADTLPNVTGYTWNNGATTQSIRVSASGSYKVVARSVNGCISDSSAAIVVTVNNPGAAPVVTLTGSTSFCGGDSATLTATVAQAPSVLSRLVGYAVDTMFTCNCPTGYIAVGYQLYSGGLIDRFRLACKPLNPNGTLGSTIVYTDFAGRGNGGNPTLDIIATDNSALTLLRSRVATNRSINSLVGVVTPITSIQQGNNTGSVRLQAVEGGFGGDVPDSVSAPLGHVIIGMETYANPSRYAAGYRLRTVPITSVLPNVIWSNGKTTPIIKVKVTGNYSVRNILNGCTTAASNAIAITATPIAQIIGSNTFCAGGSTVLTSNSPRGNRWSNGDTATSITVRNTSNITLRAVTGRCTSVTATFAVRSVPTPGTPTITASQLVLNEGDSCVFRVTNPNTNYTYVWSNGLRGSRIVVRNADSITCRAMVSNCYSAVSRLFVVTGLLGNVKQAYGLELYPNPTTGIVNLTTSPAVHTVHITNNLGQVVYKQAASPSMELNLNFLPKGLYTVKAIGNAGVSTQKLVVR